MQLPWREVLSWAAMCLYTQIHGCRAGTLPRSTPVRLQQIEAGEHGLRQGAALVPRGLSGKQAVCDSQDVCRGELCCCRSLQRRPVIILVA